MKYINLKSKIQSDAERLIKEQPELVDEILKSLRRGGKDNRFDLNLVEGQASERLIEQLLSGKRTIEVKRDFRVGETGNIPIEYACSGKYSGIVQTKADYYAFVLDGEEYNQEVVVLISTARLKRLFLSRCHTDMATGDNGHSQFRLLNKADLLATNFEINECPSPLLKIQNTKLGSRVKTVGRKRSTKQTQRASSVRKKTPTSYKPGESKK